MIEHMFDTLTEAELQTEDNLVLELEADPDRFFTDEPVVLPPDLDSWEADLRLAAVLSAVDVNRLSGTDRVTYMKAQYRLNSSGQARFLGSVNAVSDA
ncbi:MAG: hypothetical protein WD156_05125 [Acidimicrobiia bacterium]